MCNECIGWVGAVDGSVMNWILVDESWMNWTLVGERLEKRCFGDFEECFLIVRSWIGAGGLKSA